MWGIFDGDKKQAGAEPEASAPEPEDQEMPHYKIIYGKDPAVLVTQMNDLHAEHGYEVLTMAQSASEFPGQINYTVILELYEE